MTKQQAQKSESTVLMDQLMKDSPQIFRPRPGELVEGTVVYKGKNKLLIDIRGVSTGIISGRELRDSFNTFHDLQPGDIVAALVLEEENEEGLVVMSLRMASQRKAWDKFHKLIEQDATMKFIAQEANKGGLITNIDGIRAFLPVSQLAPANYPRVNNADSSEIIGRLQKFIGHTFTVKIVTMDEEAGKIVVSERDAMAEERAKSLEMLKIGDAKDGVVSGIVKFGLFVTFDGLEGLVHISEIAWGHVKNPSEFAHMGDRTRVKIIGVDGDKLSLSIKQLTQDPWEEVAERYPVGKKVTGTIVRFADYGAFLKIEKDINGLVHLSEIAHHKVTDPSEVLTIGQKVDAQVINIDIDERRIGLSIKALKPIDRETLERMKKEAEEAKEAKETKKAKEVKDAKEAKEGKETEDNEEKKPKVKKEKSADHKASTEGFVASKSGKKYYPAESTAGKKIAEENRVQFTTTEEAEAAGYVA